MLKAKDVWDEQENRREQRMSAMRPVLAQFHAKIRKQAIHSPNAPYIVAEIPEFVFGYPLYQLSEAREYLLKTLQASGFQVWPVNEKYLLIHMKTASHTASSEGNGAKQLGHNSVPL